MSVMAVSGNSVNDLLQNAIKPVGSTLYVWGGGWNTADDASGETALHIGVWPEWKNWFQSHRKGYSYVQGRTFWENGNREQRFWGLDCSGYIGWCLCQMRELGRDMSALQTQIPYYVSQGRSEHRVQRNRINRTGYVVPAEKMAASLADYGYGTVKRCTPADALKSEYGINPGDAFKAEDDMNSREIFRFTDDIGPGSTCRFTDGIGPGSTCRFTDGIGPGSTCRFTDGIGQESAFRPGDIVSLKGHCFICLGQCEDRSVLLIHSTPNGGVQVSGTVSERKSSLASELAADFMRRYYPEWWESFGCEGRQAVDAFVYLNGIRFRWNTGAVPAYEKSLDCKSAEEVLKYLENCVL